MKQLELVVKGAYAFCSRFGFFEPKLGDVIRIAGFNPHECTQLDKIYQLMQFTTHNSLSYFKSPIISARSEQQIFRGYNFTSVYNRRPTDAGPSFIPQELLDDINQQEDFSMKKFAKKDPSAIFNHILGMTSLRSYSRSWGVAAAFALGKAGHNGAACLEQVNHAGCVLQAHLIPQIYKLILESEPHKDMGQSVLDGNEYKLEHGAPFMPAARMSSISILIKEGGLFSPARIFNILNPLDANIQAFILANTSDEAVKMVHKYDQDALQAARQLSEIYYYIMHQQGTSREERHALYEKFRSAYEYACTVEGNFRLAMNKSIKAQKAQGNVMMQELSELPLLDVNAGNQWFVSAKSLSKGFYLDPRSANPIDLQINANGNCFVLFQTKTGKEVRINLTDRKILEMLPGYTLGPFNLLSSDGSLKKQELTPHLGQAVATSFISELLRTNDPRIKGDELEYMPSSKDMVESRMLSDLLADSSLRTLGS